MIYNNITNVNNRIQLKDNIYILLSEIYAIKTVKLTDYDDDYINCNYSESEYFKIIVYLKCGKEFEVTSNEVSDEMFLNLIKKLNIKIKGYKERIL